MKIFCSLILFVGLIVNCHGQLFNSDFELIDSIQGGTIPSGWSGDMGQGSGVIPSSHNGSNSASVWTWYTYVTGYMFNTANAAPFDNWEDGGMPINGKPSSLSGWYGYNLGSSTEMDSALMKVLLKKWNTTAMSYDTVGYGEMKFPVTFGYMYFDIPITDMAPGIDPDSIAIYMASKSGNAFCTGSDCHYFSVDDLTLNFSTGIQPLELQQSPAYPNPSTGLITITPSGASAIEVVDVTGRLIESFVPGGRETLNVDLSAHERGSYFIRYHFPNQEVLTEQVILH